MCFVVSDEDTLIKSPSNISASTQQHSPVKRLPAHVLEVECKEGLLPPETSCHDDSEENGDKTVRTSHVIVETEPVAQILFHNKKDEENEEFPNGPTSKSDPQLIKQLGKDKVISITPNEDKLLSTSNIDVNALKKDSLPSVVLVHESTQQSHFSRSQDLKDSVSVSSSQEVDRQVNKGVVISRSAPDAGDNKLEETFTRTHKHTLKYIDDSDSLDTNVSTSGKSSEAVIIKTLASTAYSPQSEEETCVMEYDCRDGEDTQSRDTSRRDDETGVKTNESKPLL